MSRMYKTKNCMQSLKILRFLLVKAAVKLRKFKLAKQQTPIQTDFLQLLSNSCTHLSNMHSSKNDSTAPRFSLNLPRFYKKKLPNKYLYFFTKLKVFLWNINEKKEWNNPLPSKSTFKYLAFSQVFWVELRRLMEI